MVRAKANRMKLLLFLSALFLSAAASARVFGAAELKRDTVEADPISGLRWLRVADSCHPGAPPKLVPLSGDLVLSRRERRPALVATSVLCVHAGDHLRLNAAATALNSMTLDAVSFGNAPCGGQVRARLAVTGKLVDVTVTSAGTGILQPPGAAR